MNIGRDEFRDIVISTLGLGVAFTIMLFGAPDRLGFLFSPEFVPAFIATTVLVAVSFAPHEMAHRVTARAIEAYAEYEMWTPGVILAVLTSFLGVAVAAVGGVVLSYNPSDRYGRWSGFNPKQHGIIAVVGPLINLSLAVIFAFAANVFDPTLQGHNLLVLGARINSFLAVFNLLPFYPLDGYRVLRWDEVLWIGTMVLALLTFLL